MKIRLHSGAKQDFDDAVSHYAAIRPELAERFIRAVNAGFDTIARDPMRWRVVKGKIRRVLTKVFPFTLLYVVRENVIFILAVAHNSREPGYWSRRVDS